MSAALIGCRRTTCVAAGAEFGGLLASIACVVAAPNGGQSFGARDGLKNPYGACASAASGSRAAPEPAGGTLSMCSNEVQIHCGFDFVLITICSPTSATSRSVQMTCPAARELATSVMAARVT